jgi:hypothetical protein
VSARLAELIKQPRSPSPATTFAGSSQIESMRAVSNPGSVSNSAPDRIGLERSDEVDITTVLTVELIEG